MMALSFSVSVHKIRDFQPFLPKCGWNSFCQKMDDKIYWGNHTNIHFTD